MSRVPNLCRFRRPRGLATELSIPVLSHLPAGLGLAVQDGAADWSWSLWAGLTIVDWDSPAARARRRGAAQGNAGWAQPSNNYVSRRRWEISRTARGSK